MMEAHKGSTSLRLLAFLAVTITCMTSTSAQQAKPLPRNFYVDLLQRNKVFYVVGRTRQTDPPSETLFLIIAPNERRGYYDVAETSYHKDGCRTMRDIYFHNVRENRLEQVSGTAGSAGVPQRIVTLLGGDFDHGFVFRTQVFLDGQEQLDKGFSSLLLHDPFRHKPDLKLAQENSGLDASLIEIPVVPAFRYECETGATSEPYCLIQRLPHTADLSNLDEMLGGHSLFYVVARNVPPAPNTLTQAVTIASKDPATIPALYWEVNVTVHTPQGCNSTHDVYYLNTDKNRLEGSVKVDDQNRTVQTIVYLLAGDALGAIIYGQVLVDGREDFGRSFFSALTSDPNAMVDLGVSEDIISDMCNVPVDVKYVFKALPVDPSLGAQCRGASRRVHDPSDF